MSRWINADLMQLNLMNGWSYLVNKLNDEVDEEKKLRIGERISVYYAVRDYLDNAPSIDIVRCRECKYWHSNTQFCDRWSHGGFVSQRTLPNDFCSCGERSE